MVVELISVGTEILLGNIVNTNAAFLARKCAELGLSNYFQISVGDNEERLTSVLNTALSRSDIIILTGGLGPTVDDLTKEVTAKVLNRNLVEDRKTRENIASYFQKRNIVVTENNWKQAFIIEDSIVIDNHNGTAPGLIVTTGNNKTIILLPGPPNELIPMFEQSIWSYLSELQTGVFYSEMIKICGIGESQAETMVRDLLDNQTNPTIAPYAKTGEVHFRVTASAENETQGKLLVKPVVDELKKRFKNTIYTTVENENLEDVIIKLLVMHKLIVSTAESCTAGLISGRIVNVPGASACFGEGFVTYSNEAKQKYLGVRQETLAQFGAVSKETVVEMLQGAVKASDSNAAIAVSGLAGPDGGTDKKPVGLVYIGCILNGKIDVKEFHFIGNREKIRDNTVIAALDLLRIAIVNEYE